MGIFDDAKTLTIGNKEVQSIKRVPDNAVLYEKPSIVSEITLLTDKSILSAYDNEQATLTAVVVDSDLNPVENVQVEFFKGSTSIGTSTTNSTGEASKVYSATGDGDVIIIAICNNLQDTVQLSDVFFYDPTEYVKTGVGGGDHSAIVRSGIDFVLPSKFELTFQMKCRGGAFRFNLCKNTSVGSNPQYGIFVEAAANTYWCAVRTTSNDGSYSSVTRENVYHSFKIRRDGSTIEFYIDGNLEVTKTATWIDDYHYAFYWSYWSDSTMSVKDLMIEEVI